MITRRRPALVSLAATLLLAIGACARVQKSIVQSEAAEPVPRPSIVFDNSANDYVDVYLAAEQRQWRLGRIAPGARATLQVPADEVERTAGFVRLVVLAGAPVSLQAARDPNAVVSIAQPVSDLLRQQWTFAHTPSMSPQVFGSRSTDRRPWR